MTDNIDTAIAFCVAAHQACGQKRKFSGAEYYTHPIEVSMLVSSLGGSDDMICAALLHDIIEDTKIQIETIEVNFGSNVARMVLGLTKVSKLEDGDRATRKAIDLTHTAKQCADTKTIKLCDVIDNLHDIYDADREWAKQYILEKELLLEVLKEGDALAWSQANRMVTAAKANLFGGEQ